MICSEGSLFCDSTIPLTFGEIYRKQCVPRDWKPCFLLQIILELQLVSLTDFLTTLAEVFFSIFGFFFPEPTRSSILGIVSLLSRESILSQPDVYRRLYEKILVGYLQQPLPFHLLISLIFPGVEHYRRLFSLQ